MKSDLASKRQIAPHFVYAGAILIGLIALAGVWAYNQHSQLTYERQVDAKKADDAAKAQQAAKEAEDAKATQAANNQLFRNICLKDADNAYWSYIKLNETSETTQQDGSVVYKAPQHVWDYAASQKKDAQDDCYRRYPN